MMWADPISLTETCSDQSVSVFLKGYTCSGETVGTLVSSSPCTETMFIFVSGGLVRQPGTEMSLTAAHFADYVDFTNAINRRYSVN